MLQRAPAMAEVGNSGAEGQGALLFDQYRKPARSAMYTTFLEFETIQFRETVGENMILKHFASGGFRSISLSFAIR